MCTLTTFSVPGILKKPRTGREIAAELAALTGDKRVRAVHALGKGDQEALWDACAGQECGPDDFVAAGTPVGLEEIHKGKNSLPAFNHFEKRFCRAEDRDGVLYGYNHNWHNFSTTGPGYFTAYWHEDYDGFAFNYYEVPPLGTRLPLGWPAVRPNEYGLARFIYSQMIDVMRKVTDGVTIGRAWRQGVLTDNYFVLCRP
ncbi:MAG: hypothetical protein H6745_23770 [Deltaproteobacteria bacterium]|nr:hypothetical protein [Deltaproteobacteria bacterium]